MSPSDQPTVLVAGAGGFLGGHLAADLLADGFQVRCVDKKPREEWFQLHGDAVNLVLDLAGREASEAACEGVDHVYNLAADMGGMGFIANHKALCMLSVLINSHLLLAARGAGVGRYFFASSACVYNAEHQRSPDVVPLREEDAYPALPEDGYGWEKLFSERMCRHFREDFGLETRVARLHNVYGPCGTFDGGREKAPAAICRKVVQAKYDGTGSIEIWGDGTQTRSFTWVADAVRGIRAVAAGDAVEPVNLGSSELVSIERLVELVEQVAGVRLERAYLRDAPVGVNGRNSDNTRFRRAYGWEPATPLAEGLALTYAWIHERMVSEDGFLRRLQPPLPSAASCPASSSSTSTTAPTPLARDST